MIKHVSDDTCSNIYMIKHVSDDTCSNPEYNLNTAHSTFNERKINYIIIL